jgi:hypothetical protein
MSRVWQGVGYETIRSEISVSGSQRNRPPGKAQPTATSICIGLSRTAKLLLGKQHEAGRIEAYVDPAFGSLHSVDVDNIVNVSELQATSIFSVEMSGVNQCSRIYMYALVRQTHGKEGGVAALFGPIHYPNLTGLGTPWVGWLTIYILLHICSKQELWKQRNSRC